MFDFGIYNVGDCIVAEVDLAIIRIKSNAKKSKVKTYHVIINFDKHVLAIHGMLPYTVITQVDERKISIVLGGLNQMVQVLQIILVVGVRNPKHFVKEASICNEISLQVAVEDLNSSLPPEEYESNNFETFRLLPRAELGMLPFPTIDLPRLRLWFLWLLGRGRLCGFVLIDFFG